MCGILFIEDRKNRVTKESFLIALNSQKWRGPDNLGVKYYGDFFKLGHNRLTILDNSSDANMPMENDKFCIIFNGEIYNHLELRKKYKLVCKTHSDTETLLEGYTLFGKKFLLDLRGMFSCILFDKEKNTWIAFRDHFGIKPLYGHISDDLLIFASEVNTIKNLIPENISISEQSILEWKSFRRPLPGNTFFNEIFEVLPGYMVNSLGNNELFFDFRQETLEVYSDELFEKYLKESINVHQLSDYKNVSLLSGGLDSAVILGLSDVQTSYTVGLPDNNEFSGAIDTAAILNRSLIQVEINNFDLVESWKKLVLLKGEPLSLPNEGLIYLVCNQMDKNEKVVLTGEGADELLFGYDRIFMWANNSTELKIDEFIDLYCYNYVGITERMKKYLIKLSFGKSPIQFLEDFFIDFHLPGLLRRMDFASMSASKEARVPFVDVKLFSLMYRKDFKVRLKNNRSKFPIVSVAKNLDLFGAISRKKVGFSATLDQESKRDEYRKFQKICLETLKWDKYI
jgi:asparagine synthase (glutamine-hydrolysing)